MQEDTSSSTHEVSALLFRTKQLVAPEAAEAPEAPEGPEGVAVSALPVLEGAQADGDGDGSEVPEVSDGAPRPSSLPHGGGLGPFKNLLLPSFAAVPPPAGGSPRELQGLSSPPCPVASPLSPAGNHGNHSAASSPRIAPMTFVANKYVLLDKVDGSSFFNCVDVHTREQLVCKVGPVSCFLISPGF